MLVECKSGYGFDLEIEFKMLCVIECVWWELDIGILVIYCGVYLVFKGKIVIEVVDDIINNYFLKLKEFGRNGEIYVDNIDVFCEKGVFDFDFIRRIF